MSLKVSAGVSKKLGLPEYSSIEASCQVEFELDPALLVSDLERFHERVRGAYIACCQAVSDELARHQTSCPPSPRSEENDRPLAPQVTGNGNGRSNGEKPPTDKQLKFIGNLVRSIKELGDGRLELLSKRMFGKPVGNISSLEASSLIDTLKSAKAGDIDISAALGGHHG
jgi:hypothetical protein